MAIHMGALVPPTTMLILLLTCSRAPSHFPMVAPSYGQPSAPTPQALAVQHAMNPQPQQPLPT